jgi:molecular chaperone GrpE (heat shock protein)
MKQRDAPVTDETACPATDPAPRGAEGDIGTAPAAAEELEHPSDGLDDPPATPSVATDGADDPRVTVLLQAVAHLEAAVLTRLEETDRSAGIIDRLEEEVRRLKYREEEKRLEPIIKSLISVHDDLAQVAGRVRGRLPDLPEQERDLAQSLLVLEKQVLEVLHRGGASEFTPELGGRFDPKRHEALGVVETPHPAEHLGIASVLTLGFEFADRVLRPAGVQVFKHTPNARPEEPRKEP